MTGQRSTQIGLTLLELIVVIAIVSLLASILFPALITATISWVCRIHIIVVET